ncbi:MAG: acyltransferase [Chloroflexota bacterium]
MIDEFLCKVYIHLSGRLGLRRLKRNGVRLGQNLRITGLPIVILKPNSSVQIGDRVTLCSTSYRTELGVNHPVILRTSRNGASIAIGDDVGISGASICASTHISIGTSSLLGANVIIADTDFHPLTKENRRYSKDESSILTEPVHIGSNVFLGANTIVLKGVTIGDNSVIGAGSVVVKDIPANCIAAGNPCKMIRPLE